MPVLFSNICACDKRSSAVYVFSPQICWFTFEFVLFHRAGVRHFGYLSKPTIEFTAMVQWRYTLQIIFIPLKATCVSPFHARVTVPLNNI